MGSWTVYEEGGYPHRLFQLDIVTSAVAMVVLGSSTLTAAGAAYQCCRDTVRRWLRWVAALAEPRDLEVLCARLDPDGMVSHPQGVASQPKRSEGGRAARVLWLLERLADLLTLRGVSLPRCGSGLARVLGHLFKRLGEVIYLTKSSPPLRTDFAHRCL